jgi:peptide/nickel transport system permease protein
MRVADLTLGMPVILLALVLVAAFGSSTASLVLILGILFMPATARLARAALLSELEADYYLAAISVGAPPWQIMLRELLPNTAPVLIARASVVAAEAIFVEASLSFVGLGVQPPAASWGTLLQKGYSNLYKSYWYPVFPGLVILIAVLALNTLGDHLQRVLDPAKK